MAVTSLQKMPYVTHRNHRTYVHLQGISRLKVAFFVSVQIIPSAALHCTRKEQQSNLQRILDNKSNATATRCEKSSTFCFIFLSTSVRLLSFGIDIAVGWIGIWAHILSHSKCATVNIIVSANVSTIY